ncbi:MAG: proton-conducting transporter membrane subunit [Alphaproteobacteria bacterium]
MTPEMLTIASIAVPAIASLLVPLFGRWPNLRDTVTMIASVTGAVVVIALVGTVLGGARPVVRVATLLPGLDIVFAVEPLGALFAATAAILRTANSLYSIGYLRAENEPRQTQFYLFFGVAITATIAVALAGNLFTLFLFYEVLTLSTYPLVTHRATPEAMRAGRLYLLMLVGSSTALLLPAIIWTGFAAGTLDFAAAGTLDGKLAPALVPILLALYVFGTGKAAVMPMHFWLPAAMVAPTPVSALLHAVAVVKTGVFVILKVIVLVFGTGFLMRTSGSQWLIYVAGFTVVVGSLIALRQDEFKRRLAYSTVSQLSYIVMAAALLTPLSVVGAALHLAAHAVSKITLFFVAGALHAGLHIDRVSEMNGIGRKMPWTMIAYTIGAISIIGLPPTAGFLGKWFMLGGAAEAGQWFVIGVLVLSTVLNAAYLLPITYNAFFRAPDAKGDAHAVGHGSPGRDEGSAAMLVAVLATALGALALFFFPNDVLELARAFGAQ